jgi:hypothetical protein
MAFGLCGTPNTFQGAMNVTLAVLLRKCTLVFLDDILVYSKTLLEYEIHILLNEIYVLVVFMTLVQSSISHFNAFYFEPSVLQKQTLRAHHNNSSYPSSLWSHPIRISTERFSEFTSLSLMYLSPEACPRKSMHHKCATATHSFPGVFLTCLRSNLH